MKKKIVIVAELDVDVKDFWKELSANIAVFDKNGNNVLDYKQNVDVNFMPPKQNEYRGNYQVQMFNQGYNKALQDVERGIDKKSEKKEVLAAGKVVNYG